MRLPSWTPGHEGSGEGPIPSPNRRAFLATTPSPLPIWRRLVTLEDACPYGVCFIIPLIMALITRGIVALLGDG